MLFRSDLEASQEYYNSLMELYAEWGVDFVKCDDICRMDAASSKKEIEMLHKAILHCGREIVLSLSPGPAIVEEAEFYFQNAEMWRITDDFWDTWPLLLNMFDRCKAWEQHVKDGCFPDCDMLPIGYVGKGFGEERLTRFTQEEQVTMMTLWCMFRSPLMLGAEMTKLDEWTKNLLTNEAVLHLLESSKGAHESYRDDKIIMWKSKDINNKDQYCAIFNISEVKQEVSLAQVLKDSTMATTLWTSERVDGTTNITIPSHGAVLIKHA